MIARRPTLWSRLGRWLRGAVRSYHWDAAKTDRLTQSRYRRAEDGSINDWLEQDLPNLRARCRHEADRNPMVDGVIFTHQTDVVGADGPDLQVESPSEAYNDWAEAHWRAWFRAPTPNPRLSGAALLRIWIRSLWTKGEVLAQKVVDPDAAGPVRLRLQPIDPRRLDTPSGMTADDRTQLGIRVSKLGRPETYYIAEVDEATGSLSDRYAAVAAADVIHLFLARDEDQIRGAPWLAPSLPTVGELRDYDRDVAEAARQAANVGVYWACESPDGAPLVVADTATLERGTQTTGPPGWQPHMLIPQQPSLQYSEYRQERQAELGRPVGMPLMVVRLDAGRHNYSSARFDGRNYARACEVIQYAISGSPRAAGPLSELVDDVLREARLAEIAQGLDPPERPATVEYHWLWVQPPHVDPAKEAEATRTKLEIGTIAYQDALAEEGESLEGMVRKRRRANEHLAAAGLPPIPTVLARGTEFARHAAATGDEVDDEEVDEEEPGGEEPESEEAEGGEAEGGEAEGEEDRAAPGRNGRGHPSRIGGLLDA